MKIARLKRALAPRTTATGDKNAEPREMRDIGLSSVQRDDDGLLSAPRRDRAARDSATADEARAYLAYMTLRWAR